LLQGKFRQPGLETGDALLCARVWRVDPSTVVPKCAAL
jgi:hypothetical protein